MPRTPVPLTRRLALRVKTAMPYAYYDDGDANPRQS